METNESAPAPEPPKPLTLAEQRAKLSSMATRIDGLLKEGARLNEATDKFYERHKLKPGSGKEALINGSSNAKNRKIMATVLDELEKAEEKVRQLKENPAQNVGETIGTKTLKSKFRV